MKRVTCIIFIMVAISFFIIQNVYAQVIKTYKDWYCAKSVDKLRDTTDYYIYTKSTNILEGWLHNGKLLLGYNDNLYMRANELGFHTDFTDFDCIRNRRQVISLKVDDGEIYNYEVEIWEDNNDGLSFPTNTDYTSLINKMKRGYKLHIEMVLFQTDGVDQVANFSLMGFTKAYNWIKQKE